jgi:hypothetical protein
VSPVGGTLPTGSASSGQAKPGQTSSPRPGHDIREAFRDWCKEHFDDLRPQGDGSYKVRCPGHDDNDPSLKVALGEDGRILLHDFSGCDIRDILDEAGLTMKDLFTFQDPSLSLSDAPRLGVPDGDDRSPSKMTLRRQVYRAILNALGLSEKHRDDLHQRGLSDAAIERNQYRTLIPSEVHKVDRVLFTHFEHDDLLQVPGTRLWRDNLPGLIHLAGLVVPVRNRHGEIDALIVRRNHREALPPGVELRRDGCA